MAAQHLPTSARLRSPSSRIHASWIAWHRWRHAPGSIVSSSAWMSRSGDSGPCPSVQPYQQVGSSVNRLTLQGSKTKNDPWQQRAVEWLCCGVLCCCVHLLTWVLSTSHFPHKSPRVMCPPVPRHVVHSFGIFSHFTPSPDVRSFFLRRTLDFRVCINLRYFQLRSSE